MEGLAVHKVWIQMGFASSCGGQYGLSERRKQD